jgi:hypothetical protein
LHPNQHSSAPIAQMVPISTQGSSELKENEPELNLHLARMEQNKSSISATEMAKKLHLDQLPQLWPQLQNLEL